MAHVQRELTIQMARNKDQEAGLRRCLRITPIKERGEDATRPTDSILWCLKEALGLEELPLEALGLEELPLLERAHRTLRVRPGDTEPPKAFAIRCHYFQQKEAILKKSRAMKQLTTVDGDKICVQPDYTQAVVKQRYEFNRMRDLLRVCGGVRYGLWYQRR